MIAANLGLSRGGNASSNNDNNGNNDCADCSDRSNCREITTTNKENDNGNGNISNTNSARDKESETDIVVLEVRESNGKKENAETNNENMGGRSQNKKTQIEKMSA